MRKYIASLIAALMLALLGINAFAAQEAECTAFQDRDTMDVLVNGRLDGGKTVLLAVVDSGKRLEQIMLPDGAEGVHFVGQTRAAADGTYQLTIQLPDEIESGAFDVLYRNADMDEYGRASFDFVSVKNIREGLDAINRANSKTEMAKAIQENAGALGLDMSEYGKYGTADQEGVCDVILHERPAEAYQTIKEVNDAFGHGLLLNGINRETEQSALLKLLEENKTTLGIELSDLNALSKSIKKAAVDKIMKTSFLNLARFRDEFNEALVTGAVGGANLSYELSDLLQNKLSGLIGLETGAGSDFAKLKDQLAVFELMLTMDFPTIQSVREGFNRAAAACLALENPGKKQDSSDSSGGGSGGGHRGGGSAVGGATGYIPSENPEQPGTDDPQQPDVEIFGDLEGYDWAAESIAALTELGCISGDGSGSFAPGRAVTREELVKMTVIAFDLMDETAEVAFDDVPADAWYHPYIASAVKNDVIKGIGGSLFGTGAQVTRQDAATILYRVLTAGGVELPEGKPVFQQENVADYAAQAVRDLASAGIIGGDGEGLFHPERPATRAEMAKMLYESYRLKNAEVK